MQVDSDKLHTQPVTLEVNLNQVVKIQNLIEFFGKNLEFFKKHPNEVDFSMMCDCPTCVDDTNQFRLLIADILDKMIVKPVEM
jgi:hypothetical protein